MRIHSGPSGTVHRIAVDSAALRGNLLGDPSTRLVDVYIPAGQTGSGLPLLVDLVGFTSSGLSHTNWAAFQENVPERLDRLIGAAKMPPVVAAFPDCFTRLGGNQYVNSAATGAWEDYLLGEMLPAVERRFGCGGEGRRGVFGKSSGGYGAIVHALRHPDIWAAAACHSGDMAFEPWCCRAYPRPTIRSSAGGRNSNLRANVRTMRPWFSISWPWRPATTLTLPSIWAFGCRSRSTPASCLMSAGPTGCDMTR